MTSVAHTRHRAGPHLAKTMSRAGQEAPCRPGFRPYKALGRPDAPCRSSYGQGMPVSGVPGAPGDALRVGGLRLTSQLRCRRHHSEQAAQAQAVHVGCKATHGCTGGVPVGCRWGPRAAEGTPWGCTKGAWACAGTREAHQRRHRAPTGQRTQGRECWDGDGRDTPRCPWGGQMTTCGRPAGGWGAAEGRRAGGRSPACGWGGRRPPAGGWAGAGRPSGGLTRGRHPVHGRPRAGGRDVAWRRSRAARRPARWLGQAGDTCRRRGGPSITLPGAGGRVERGTGGATGR